jgi:preprotein translocase subunit SecG
MTNIQTTVLVVHTLIALGIIALVLLQRGKGADAGAAFAAFFATSLTLAFMSAQQSDSIDSLLENAPASEAGQVAPVSEPVEDAAAEFPALEESTEPVVDDEGMPALDAEEAETGVEPTADPVPE